MEHELSEFEKKNRLLLFVLLMVLLIVNYPLIDRKIDDFLERTETVKISRVISPVIIEKEDGERLRLFGINIPNEGEIYLEEANEFLKDLILNETVDLRFGKKKYDEYQRVLAYVFLNGENVNTKIVEEGFANLYFPYDDKLYYSEMLKSWERCIENEKRICQPSQDICADCIELVRFDYLNQIIVFHNKCFFNCNLEKWTLKNEEGKEYFFDDFALSGENNITIIVGDGNDTQNVLFWDYYDVVWLNKGDTLFLRDQEGKLVLWNSYQKI